MKCSLVPGPWRCCACTVLNVQIREAGTEGWWSCSVTRLESAGLGPAPSLPGRGAWAPPACGRTPSRELGTLAPSQVRLCGGSIDIGFGICSAEEGMRRRKFQGRGSKQYEQRLGNTRGKAGFLGMERRVPKRAEEVNRILHVLHIHLFLKNPLSNNFTRGNSSAERAEHWEPPRAMPRLPLLSEWGMPWDISLTPGG